MSQSRSEMEDEMDVDETAIISIQDGMLYLVYILIVLHSSYCYALI